MSENYKKLGQKIRYYRQQKDYSQQELGDRVGYSQDAISCFEMGKRRLDAIAVFSIADELGCEVDDLNPFQEWE